MDEIIHVKNEYRQQRWAELIRQRQESGMSGMGFCEANGLKAKTYYYWLRKLRMRLCEQTVVALPMPTEESPCLPTSGTITVRRGDITVEIGDGMSEATIRAVVGALAGGC